MENNFSCCCYCCFVGGWVCRPLNTGTTMMGPNVCFYSILMLLSNLLKQEPCNWPHSLNFLVSNTEQLEKKNSFAGPGQWPLQPSILPSEWPTRCPCKACNQDLGGGGQYSPLLQFPAICTQKHTASDHGQHGKYLSHCYPGKCKLSVTF